MQPKRLFLSVCFLFSLFAGFSQETEITKWQDGKAAAISLTFDDGSPNQFSVALPLLNELKIPATFFIITGEIEGSQYHGKFIGRPVEDIIKGTADTPTNKQNFFERASAVGFLGYKGTLTYHTNAGTLFEQEKFDAAYKLIDSAYKKVRNGEFQRSGNAQDADRHLTWDAVRKYAAQGHEFASHTVTHPRLAVLTEPNMIYELEKSKEEIRNKLGEKYTFSAEGPYGTEDERAMSYAYKIYPALRNRMPEEFLGELNRASKIQPGTVDKEYVQWQRGAVTTTSLPLMKSWIDTVVAHNNNWLVLVFHGVDGKGWEALPGSLLKEYFGYIRKNDDRAWIATFGDVAKYMRERMNGDVKVKESKNKFTVELTHSLDKKMYDLPLTLKTVVPANWKKVSVKQAGKTQTVPVTTDASGNYILYQLMPNKGTAEVSAL
ncbi:MAG: polysaccharide deacetylase family protein [Chitinophagaceae bacterium]|nr:polysaccharide deacetylase family protein [Chitinophagaceae bacterium]